MALSSRKRQRGSTLLKLVVFFTITGTLTFLIGTQIARVSFGGGGYQVTATFDDVTGLMKGDVVKIAGAPVGQVDSIEVKRGKAVVALTVQEKFRVPADSEAAIRWRTAIGQRVVYLIPGTSAEKIKDGAHITKTRSVVDIGELVDQMAPLARSLKPEQLNQILTSIYLAMDGNKENVSQLIANVDQLTSTISARRTTLNQILENYTKVTGVIARRDRQIRQMTDNLVELSDAFVRNRKLIDSSLVELGEMFQTSDKLIGQNGDQLEKVVAALAIITAGIDGNVGSVKELLDLTGPKLKRLFSMLDAGDYAKGGVACLTLIDGPCPYPVVLKNYQGDPQSPQTLRKILVGGN